MTASKLSQKVVTERVSWIRTMLADVRALPMKSYETFVADRRNISAAESCLRRSLEALMDLGRHMLARGFSRAAAEYRDIPVQLQDVGVLSIDDKDLMIKLAGYRNRLVHFYHEISTPELYDICAHQLADVERLTSALSDWIGSHPDLVDDSL